MTQLDLVNLLPMLPWEGPPLPRFLGVYWVRTQQATESPPMLFGKYVAGVEVEEDRTVDLLPHRGSPVVTSYENEEEWEISWSEEGLPVKIIVHRSAVRNGGG